MTTKHYVIFTDTNSRQYPIEISEEGLSIFSIGKEFIITIEEPNIELLLQLIHDKNSFFVGGKTLFNPLHLVAIQLQSHES